MLRAWIPDRWSPSPSSAESQYKKLYDDDELRHHEESKKRSRQPSKSHAPKRYQSKMTVREQEEAAIQQQRESLQTSTNTPSTPTMQIFDGRFYSDDDEDEWVFRSPFRNPEVSSSPNVRRIPIEDGDTPAMNPSSNPVNHNTKIRRFDSESSLLDERPSLTSPSRHQNSNSRLSACTNGLTIKVPPKRKEAPLYNQSIDPSGRGRPSAYRISPSSASSADTSDAVEELSQLSIHKKPPKEDFPNYNDIMRDATPSSVPSDLSGRFSPLLTGMPLSNTAGMETPLEVKLSTDVDELNDQLANQNLRVHIIVPDGNCAFRALSFLLHGTEKRHLFYRDQVVETMRNNESFFKDFITDDFQEHCETMSQRGEWADNVELYAMSMLTKKRILVHQLNQPTQIISASKEYRDELHFSYHLQCHYNAVVSTQKQTSAEDDDPYLQIMKLTGVTDTTLISRFLEENDYNVNNTIESILKKQEQENAPVGMKRVMRSQIAMSPVDGFLSPSSFGGATVGTPHSSRSNLPF